MNDPESGADNNRWMRWLLGVPGLAVGFLWGAAEGSFFFIIPDLIITLVALFSFKRSLLQIAAVLAGSLLAGASMYAWGQASPDAAKDAVKRVPFVRGSMFEKTQRDFESSGAWALCAGPMSGIPYKVYAIQAPAYCSLPAFLLASIPARLERFVMAWAVFAVVGWFLRRRKKGPAAALVFFSVYWTAVYAVYWSTI